MNNLIPPPKDLGVFITILEVEGDSLTGHGIEGSSEEYKEVHGYSRIRSFKVQKTHRVEELGLISRNSCKHIVFNICYLVDDHCEGILVSL